MDLVGERTDVLLQLSNDERVDVLIGRAFVERRFRRSIENSAERCDELIDLARSKQSDPAERSCECLRAANVGRKQTFIKMERAREALEDLRRALFESAAPELHTAPPMSISSSAFWTC